MAKIYLYLLLGSFLKVKDSIFHMQYLLRFLPFKSYLNAIFLFLLQAVQNEIFSILFLQKNFIYQERTIQLSVIFFYAW